MKKLQGKPPSLWLLFPMVVMTAMTLFGCPPGPINPLPDADASSVDAAAPPFGTYTCTTWCNHGAEMGCPGARPTEHGATCVEVCHNTLDSPSAFNVQCRTLASSCAAADACENPAQAQPIAPDQDAAAEAVAQATCASWCAHATALKCASAKPTPKGANCAEVCANVQSGPIKWNLKCRAAAKTCAAADACK